MGRNPIGGQRAPSTDGETKDFCGNGPAPAAAAIRGCAYRLSSRPGDETTEPPPWSAARRCAERRWSGIAAAFTEQRSRQPIHGPPAPQLGSSAPVRSGSGSRPAICR